MGTKPPALSPSVRTPNRERGKSKNTGNTRRAPNLKSYSGFLDLPLPLHLCGVQQQGRNTKHTWGGPE